MVYEERTYRRYSSTAGLVSFAFTLKETDLFISASRNLETEARHAALQARLTIEEYISKHPSFQHSLIPLPFDASAPAIIKGMLTAAAAAGVGPMAAVAGAVAEQTGRKLLGLADEVIVENGGDIFLKINREITVAVHAGGSPLSQKIGIRVSPNDTGLSICTSSGTVGPSLSFGTADAVTVRSLCSCHADAAATAIGNIIKGSSDIQRGIQLAQNIPLIEGVLIIKGKTMGVWGAMELVRL